MNVFRKISRCYTIVIGLLVFCCSSPGVIADEEKTILVVGDSLSAAYNMAEDRGWVALLQKQLTERHSDYRLVNASVSGATTAAGLQILPASLREHKPSIVIIELGANDGLQGKPLQYIRRNLERLIQLSKSHGAEVLLFGMHLPPNYGEAYTGPFFEQYALIADTEQIAYLPFFLDGVAGHSEYIMADGLHPNEAAQPKLMQNVYKALRPLLKKVAP